MDGRKEYQEGYMKSSMFDVSIVNTIVEDGTTMDALYVRTIDVKDAKIYIFRGNVANVVNWF